MTKLMEVPDGEDGRDRQFLMVRRIARLVAAFWFAAANVAAPAASAGPKGIEWHLLGRTDDSVIFAERPLVVEADTPKYQMTITVLLVQESVAPPGKFASIGLTVDIDCAQGRVVAHDQVESWRWNGFVPDIPPISGSKLTYILRSGPARAVFLRACNLAFADEPRVFFPNYAAVKMLQKGYVVPDYRSLYPTSGVSDDLPSWPSTDRRGTVQLHISPRF